MRRIAPALLLAAAVYGLFWGRRLFIRSWFVQGPARPASRAEPRAGRVAPHQVRVLLIDGLSREVARRLPALSRLCRQGLELALDVGFPTVSLPEQHVLWTGAWQDQSGVMFLVKRMARPVYDSLPGLVTRRGGGAVAVAEGEPYIVTSFPFSRVVAPREAAGPGAGKGQLAMLTPLDLQQESLAAMQSSAALVLVHFLAVDHAGHKVGSAGAAYLKEARRADALLGALQTVRRPDQTLLVLSDHGHLRAPPGGHGGTEPGIATVRACIVGPDIPAGRRAAAVLPDVTRILAERLDVAPPACVGRSLAGVLRGDPPGAQAIAWRWRVWTASGLVLGLWLVLLAWRRQPALLPWGLLLSLALLVALEGRPSLSRYYVYRSLPWSLLPAALPTLLLPALQLFWLRRRRVRFGVTLLAAAGLLPAVVAVGLTGWPATEPPLWPQLTAWASTLGLLGLAWLVGLALAAALLGPGEEAT